MNDTFTLALIVSAMSLMLILFIALIIYVCTYHMRIYKNFKKPVKTMGVVDDVRRVKAEHHGEDYYVITYSYTDNCGVRRTNTFKWLQSVGKAGNKFALYYDSQSPHNSISGVQLKYGKNLWRKVLIILAVLIVPSIFAGVYFSC